MKQLQDLLLLGNPLLYQVSEPVLQSEFPLVSGWVADLHNVMEEIRAKYNFGRANCTGLGDFIRGSYFILEFCDEYNFEPKIVFNNYIAKFLRTKTYKLKYLSAAALKFCFWRSSRISA